MAVVPTDPARKDLLKRRLTAIKAAKKSLLDFAKLIHEDPAYPDDPAYTKYMVAKHHEAIAKAMEKVESGKIKRLIVSVPPRHGKSELATKTFVPWYMGRNPLKSVIVGTYNDQFAGDMGREIRNNILHPGFKQVFDEMELRVDSKAAGRMINKTGGALFCVGRNSAVTGRGGDCIILDDPLKNRQEADSKTIRETLWTWFTQVISTRLMTDEGVIVIIQCMVGDTKVLMADGSETELKDIKPGDRIATFEDGKLTKTKVLNWKNNGPDLVYAIKMKSGIIVRANERHPFLVNVDGEPKWIRLKNIVPGQEIYRARKESGLGLSAKPKGATQTFASEDTATLTTTSGDGSLDTGHHLLMQKTDGRPASNTDTGLLSKNTTGCSKPKGVGAPFVENCPEKMSGLTGAANCVSTIATTLKKFGAYCATIAIWPSDTEKHPKSSKKPPNICDFTLDTVEEIYADGYEDVFDIQVERTENFIANGLVSHNTRWHEDDLIGRLTDPYNPHYDPREAAKWTFLDLPALAEKKDPLKRKEGEPLWPERFGREYLLSLQSQDPRGFNALYQGRPSADTGSFFNEKDLLVYGSFSDLPKNLRYYVASDHALGLTQEHDKTCCIPIGVDEEGTAWVHPDIFWDRQDTHTTVQRMIRMIKSFKPLFWWAENGHITKSIGPFLRREMVEQQAVCALIEMTPIHDKLQRAQSIHGRISLGRVRFPAFAQWWPDAKRQILQFPYGANDDFVDAMSLLGLGLQQQIRAAPPPKEEAKGPAIGTVGWVKWQAEKENRFLNQHRNTAGW